MTRAAGLTSRAPTSPLIDIVRTLNPLLWLKSESVYDHVTRQLFNDGASVRYWMDDSRYQHNCHQETALNQPTYSAAEGCLYFDGTNSLLTCEIGGAVTPQALLAVVKFDGTGNFPTYNGIVTGQTGDNAHRGLIALGASTSIYDNAAAMTLYTDGAAGADLVNINTWHIVYGEQAAGLAYTTGYQIGQDRATTTRRWKGWIKEVIILPAVPSAANRALLFSEVNRRLSVY